MNGGDKIKCFDILEHNWMAAVPEALAAIVTGALAIGMHQMAKENVLIRKIA